MPTGRLGVITCLLVPLFLLVWDAYHHMLGVNAVNFAIHTTGKLAVVCLLLSLCITPIKSITGFTWLIQFRRALGVYGFYYAAAHLLIYFWWDRQGQISSTAYEITHRFFLGIGFASLAIMTPLWATSFNAAIQKLGGARWKQLHRLAYPAVALACYHYYLQSKADKRLPDLAIGILAALLIWRVVAAIRTAVQRANVRANSPAPSSTSGAPLTVGKSRFWSGQLRVIGMFRETPTVRTFRLASADGGPIPFAFQAGQFLNLTLQLDQQRTSRSYTIASPPTRDGYVELTIKREGNGKVSQYLHDMMMTGQLIDVSAPAGRFIFDPNQHIQSGAGKTPAGVLLLAGGVGITPVMSILRDLTDRCWNGNIDLVFSVRTPDEVIFADELRLLQSRFPNVRMHLTFTRNAPDQWTGLQGRITGESLRQLVPDLLQRKALVCGPDAMASAMKEELIRIGFPADRITLESFTPAAAVKKDASADVSPSGLPTATVNFSRTGVIASLTSPQTILDAAESAGVQIDFQCRSGVCGTCRTRLLTGKVAMEVREALSDSDEKEGYILACQAQPVGDVSVDA